MKRIFFTACILLFYVFANAQVINWNGITNSEFVGDKVLVLEDSAKNLSIDQVAGESFSKNFIPSTKKILDFKFSPSVYWIKFSVDNKSSDKLLLEVAQALLPSVDLYFKDSLGKWQSYKAGFKINLNEKIIRHHYQLFPLTEKNGSEYYLRIQASGLPIPLSLWKQDVYEIKATNQKIIYGIYMGIMLFVILYNLFLFFSLRKLGYLHYSFLVLLYATFSGIFDGYLSYLFPNMDLQYWYILNPIINQPNGLLFCLLFLDVKKYLPRAYKISIGVLIYFISYIVWYNFLPTIQVLPISQLHALIGILLMATLGILVGRKGNKLGYYFSLTYFLFFALASMEVVYDQSGSPSYFFELSHVSSGIFVEVFLLSYLLSLRFKWEKKEIETAKAEAQHMVIEKTKENEKIVREQNIVLEQKVEERTHELKATQQQLIQKEKLASLGQLTAGIAHEIKNPLNFINNFSELTTDLIEELAAATNEEERSEVSNDIRNNLKIITQHGKRADQIVESMLLHSRESSGEMQLTDINLICEEAVDLAAQSIKAKTLGFVCEIEKSFAPDLPRIKMVQEDISRVLLNIVSNALYILKEKKEKGKVTITSAMKNNFVTVTVTDNGHGIPDNIKDKIFQPFFTTKPTGEGTGLGLSISYDIVKAHNGDIKVSSKVGEGTSFTISLPI